MPTVTGEARRPLPASLIFFGAGVAATPPDRRAGGCGSRLRGCCPALNFPRSICTPPAIGNRPHGRYVRGSPPPPGFLFENGLGIHDHGPLSDTTWRGPARRGPAR